MSLLCAETGKDIEYGQPLKAGTRSDVDFYSAFGPEVIDRIPIDARQALHCDPKQGGVDIHEASSDRNFNDSYTLCHFTLGKFLFSLSQENAEKYLSNHMKMYAPNLNKESV